MLSWLDVIIAALFAIILVGEVKRGFGKALFDFGAVILTLIITNNFSGQIAKTVSLSPDRYLNSALVYGIIFVIAGVILLLIGKFLYETTLISVDVFDPLLGGILGIGIAIVVGHAVAQIVAFGTMVDGTSEVVMNSVMGKELLTFETYKHILQSLYNFDR